MLEGHQLLKINGEHTEEDGITKRTQESRQIKCLQGQSRVDEEIHHDRIAHHSHNSQSEKTCILLSKHLAPEQAEKAACDGSHPLYKVEHIGGECTKVQDTTRKAVCSTLGVLPIHSTKAKRISRGTSRLYFQASGAI